MNNISQLSKAMSLVLLTSTLLLSGCESANSSPDTEKKDVVVSIPVEAAKVSRGEISSTYRTTSTLEAKADAEVNSKATGIVQTLLVEEGDHVQAGQVLATLDTERQQLALAKGKADLGQLKSELERVEKMHQRKLVSTDVYDKLKWQVESLDASVRMQELALRDTKIVAPISGVIARRYAKVGQLITEFSSKSLFHVVSQQYLEAVINLPEHQLSRAKVGQTAYLNFAGMPQLQAKIIRISPVVDATTGTARVTIGVQNDDLTLKAGMFAQIELQYDTKPDALLVPKRAVLAMDNSSSVFVVKDGKVARKTVKTGYENDAMVEITEGISAGDEVVTAGQASLKDASAVTVISSNS
ncbi:efflux RND transporter periplasmic adaptor subunit [Rheinheimera texasensis]|uniref:efflux RND transporter periplasmic adaptor subunit n=1 Tax=Rheinheimera texasensis TaxID=306205 RepID=UPI0004E25F4B|nr:efflux RND transporter periplasmic adaptor subunit [Rheinheimera texasensis]